MGLYLNRLSIRHFGRIRDPNSSRGPVGAAVTKRTSDIFMLDQLDSSTEKFTSPTGLRVRQDLYDEVRGLGPLEAL